MLASNPGFHADFFTAVEKFARRLMAATPILLPHTMSCTCQPKASIHNLSVCMQSTA